MQRLFVSLAVVFLGCLAVPATLNAYDAADYLKSGDAWRERGEYGKALAEYNQALRLDPNNAAAMYDIARLEATCPDEKYRDGRKAFENANKAYQLSGGEDWGRTDTLAAVYAECGDFDKARAWEAKAIAMAPDEKSKDIALPPGTLQARKALPRRTWCATQESATGSRGGTVQTCGHLYYSLASWSASLCPTSHGTK